MSRSTIFARRVFLWAGIYGIAVLAPLYFLEERIGREVPPPITHPENFYGFLGVALAWQLAFLVISRDVVRFRPLMLPAIAEKLLAAGAFLVLLAQGRVGPVTAAPAAVDLVLAALFLAAFRSTREIRSRAG